MHSTIQKHRKSWMHRIPLLSIVVCRLLISHTWPKIFGELWSRIRRPRWRSVAIIKSRILWVCRVCFMCRTCASSIGRPINYRSKWPDCRRGRRLTSKFISLHWPETWWHPWRNNISTNHHSSIHHLWVFGIRFRPKAAIELDFHR